MAHLSPSLLWGACLVLAGPITVSCSPAAVAVPAGERVAASEDAHQDRPEFADLTAGVQPPSDEAVQDGARAEVSQAVTLGRPALSPGESFPTFPLPDGNPSPLGGGGFGNSFRDPLPNSPVWNPPGPKRVGLQAGHWFTGPNPYELRNLSPGSSAGGWAEWQVNLLLAQHTARILGDAGVEVDVLPSTIPVRYRAQAFVSIHADGDTGGLFRGYKVASPGFSSIPEADDRLVQALYDEYGAATGLPRDSDTHISRRMVFYYAFNTRRYQHAIDLGTPSAIIEAGFMTSAIDRAFLTNNPEIAARGIANGVLRFLSLELGARVL